MTTPNLAYITKLIDASEALNEQQKSELKGKLGTMSEEQLAEIVNILDEEQHLNAAHYRKVGHIKTKAAEDKIKLVYDYAEHKLNLEEEHDIAELEDQLAHLDA